MDAASGNALSRLKADVAELITLFALSAGPFLSHSDDRNEADGAGRSRGMAEPVHGDAGAGADAPHDTPGQRSALKDLG
jgi:hypothetical protein